MSQKTLLDHLRTRSYIDCDTLDVSTAKSLGPFQDSTSNQAIAYFELREHSHQDIIQDALSISQKLSGTKDAVRAVEIAMTMLALRMLPHLRGTTHIQVNPFHSSATSDIVNNARAIIGHARIIDPMLDTSRLCVKIPSTWEGLQACRTLEAEGIKTLATIVFSPEQVAFAGQVGCSYIAPYINELRVHFDAGFEDADPSIQLIPWAQAYYRRHKHQTQVMPASLTSVREVMALAGADHITVAPQILKSLHETVAGDDSVHEYPSVFDEDEMVPALAAISLEDKASFEEALANGKSERKLNEAIQIFCDFQQKLEQIFKDAIHAAACVQ